MFITEYIRSVVILISFSFNHYSLYWMVSLLDVFELRAKCLTLRNVDKIVVCCKRNVVRKLVARTVVNGKRIRKDSIIKQRSALLDGTCLYLFVDKYVDSGAIEHYFRIVNRAFDMSKVKCTIRGTYNDLRKATLRRLLSLLRRDPVESEYSSDGSTSS